MTFYVQKSLAHGPIRFGVSPRLTLDQIDSDSGLSTGKSGEFLRRGMQGFFIADTRAISAPVIPASPSISKTPFWQSLRGDTKGLAWLALMILGAIFVLLGFAVIAKKGAAGWVEVILGAIMIGVPIALTAQKRKQIREQEEKERAEREESERRHRAMLESYTAALQRLRESPNDETLAEVTREREALEVPYEIWSPLAKRTVLQMGFDSLARLGPSGAKATAELMSRAGAAAGLTEPDKLDTKHDLYRVFVWHLLADDRLGRPQSEQLQMLRSGLGIADADVPSESQSIEEFRKLQGVTPGNLPRVQCTMRLKFREYCVHATRGTLLNEKGAARGTGSLFVTNKRVYIDVKKVIEIELTQIDDVEVDIDLNLLTIKAAMPKKPVIMRVEQPVFTAALIDLATSIDERPKGFS
ncbi:MAG TPA: hypothetical protein VF505_13230 [Thermoanaerobaculia bacterium]